MNQQIKPLLLPSTAPAMTNTAANAAALPTQNAVPDPLATPGEPSAEKRGITLSKPGSVATGGEFPESSLPARDEEKLSVEDRPLAKELRRHRQHRRFSAVL